MRSSSSSSSALFICAFGGASLLASAAIAGCSSSDKTTDVMTPAVTTDASADASSTTTPDAATTTTTSGAVTATLSSGTFTPVAFLSEDITDGGNAYWDGTTTTFEFSTASGACTDLASNKIVASSVDVFFQLSAGIQTDDAGGMSGSPVTGAGTFPVTTSPAAGTNGTQGELDQLDSSCSTSGANGKDVFASGTVTITARTSAGITGSLDVVTQNGIHVSGSFSTAECQNLGALGGDHQTCSSM